MSRYYAMRDPNGDIRAYVMELRESYIDLSVPAQMLRLEATFEKLARGPGLMARLRAEETDMETVLHAAAFELAPIYTIRGKKPRSLTGNMSTYLLEEVDVTV